MHQSSSAADILARFAAGAEGPRPLALVSLDKPLRGAVQRGLSHHGLLDPLEDGLIGPVTSWALQAFARAAGLLFENDLSPDLARGLADPAPVAPRRPGDGFAAALLRALERRGDWLCRHVDAVNVVYVEGTEPDGAPSPGRPDAFDDLRLLLGFDPDGAPAVRAAWHATTRAGQTALDEPVDELGPPRLQPGQYKAWVAGTTAIGTKLEQDALVQVVELPVHRDAGKDHRRAGDPHQTGFFVIDQHGGLDEDRHRVGDASAGCLVTPRIDDQRAFMAMLRRDPRWRASNAYRFMTSLLTRAEFEQA